MNLFVEKAFSDSDRIASLEARRAKRAVKLAEKEGDGNPYENCRRPLQKEGLKEDSKSFEEATEKDWERLSKKEKDLVLNYAASLYHGVNEGLRSGKSGLGEDFKPTVRAMDKVLGQSRVPESLVLFRGVPASHFGSNDFDTGSELNDLGFVSVSHSEKIARRFALGDGPGGAFLEINVPKGSKGNVS